MLAQVLDFVACHVWVYTVALPRRNNQTWHATSLHFAAVIRYRKVQTWHAMSQHLPTKHRLPFIVLLSIGRSEPRSERPLS